MAGNQYITHSSELSHIAWKKSSLSTANGQCVEIALLQHDHVGIRDSKDRNVGAPILTCTSEGWKTFLRNAKEGRLDFRARRRAIAGGQGAPPAMATRSRWLLRSPALAAVTDHDERAASPVVPGAAPPWPGWWPSPWPGGRCRHVSRALRMRPGSIITRSGSITPGTATSRCRCSPMRSSPPPPPAGPATRPAPEPGRRAASGPRDHSETVRARWLDVTLSHRSVGKGKEVKMKHIVQEVGRTVRAALGSWPETIRLCVLLAVVAAAWTCYHLWG